MAITLFTVKDAVGALGLNQIPVDAWLTVDEESGIDRGHQNRSKDGSTTMRPNPTAHCEGMYGQLSGQTIIDYPC